MASKSTKSKAVKLNVDLSSDAFDLSHISQAITLLKAGEEEVKTAPIGREIPNEKSVAMLIPQPSLLAVAQSVFTPGKVYRIRTVRVATLVSSGGGTMLLATSINPQQMSQASSLTALFGECRLHSTRIRYVFRSPTGGPNTMISAFDPSNNGVSPASAVAVMQIPGARPLNTWNTITSPMLSWKAKQPRPWSRTSASTTGTDPVGGTAGCWLHALSTAVSGAINVADYHIECDYEFRNPQ